MNGIRRLLTTASVGLALLLGAPGATQAADPGPASLAEAEAALHDAVRARFGPAARVRVDGLRGTPRALRGLDAPTTGPDAAERARRFLEQHRDLLGLRAASRLEVTSVRRAHGRTTVRLAHHVEGLPVEGHDVTLTMDAGHRVRGVRSDAFPIDLPPLAHDVGPASAVAAVRARFAAPTVGTPTRVILAAAPGHAVVAWRVPVVAVPLAGHFNVWVDAATGAVLRQAPAASDQTMTTLPERQEGSR